MKTIPALVLLILLCPFLQAKRIVVTSATSINNGNWAAGDTVVMKNGTWNNQSISFKAMGTINSPVVLQAETEGSVILTGTSRLSFSGSYLVISGLYFKDGSLSGSDIISFKTSSSETAFHCTLKNTVITNYNPSDKTIDSKWVSLYGSYNTVDHCSFENKTNSGTLLVVWLTNGTGAYHTISNNYFGLREPNVDTNGEELNGQEIMRIGDSSTSMTSAGVVVSRNFFEHCNGEIEVISNKSCGNTYTNNVFLECKGMLTLRHGNNCTVAGNYFFGNNISETGGVRIIGENHNVYNNYFENLKGTNYRAALCIVRGKQNSALNEYFQVKNALVAFNTFVNCAQAFCINYNSSSSLTLPPVNTTIAHNHIYNTSTACYNVVVDQTNVAKMTVSWKNNLMNQGKYSAFSFAIDQIITGQDAAMERVNTSIPIYEPTINSALKNFITNEYAEIISDIRGRIRGENKIPGVSQLSGTTTRTMPDRETVGALFFNNRTTNSPTPLFGKKLTYHYTTSGIEVNTTSPGFITISDLNGTILFTKKTDSSLNINNFSKKGIYLLKFTEQNGTITSQKILIKN